MSDRHASIRIGGTISRRTLEEIVEAACIDGAGTDYGRNLAVLNPDDALGEVLESIEDGTLNLYDDCSRFGTFTSLESACTLHGLTYVRVIDPDAGEPGQVSWWEPGMTEPASCEADGDGAAVVGVDLVIEAMSKSDPLRAVEELIRPLRIVTVPPLRIDG